MIKKINLIFVTFLRVGYIKIAPGTFASLFTSIIFFYLFRFRISIEHFLILCLIMILVFTYSLYAIKTIENEFEQKDARQIVIDEVIGANFKRTKKFFNKAISTNIVENFFKKENINPIFLKING